MSGGVIVGDSGLCCCGPAFNVMCDVNCSSAITSHCLLILLIKLLLWPPLISDGNSKVVASNGYLQRELCPLSRQTVTHSDKRATKFHFVHFELLIPIECAIDELSIQISFKTVHSVRVK